MGNDEGNAEGAVGVPPLGGSENSRDDRLLMSMWADFLRSDKKLAAETA